jgi:hypothetical protein
LVADYKFLTTAKPPRGDAASWKEKTGKLYAAALALEHGESDAIAKYKEALNCKACHSAHCVLLIGICFFEVAGVCLTGVFLSRRNGAEMSPAA